MDSNGNEQHLGVVSAPIYTALNEVIELEIAHDNLALLVDARDREITALRNAMEAIVRVVSTTIPEDHAVYGEVVRQREKLVKLRGRGWHPEAEVSE